MRGWTNIAGGGINLNAGIQEFTVANGKSVVAGDFVELYTIESESVLTYANIKQGKTAQISENLVITQSGETLYLLKMEEGRLNIVDSYSEKAVGGFCITENGGIAVAIKSSPYLVKLKVQNGFLAKDSEAQSVDDISPGTLYGISVEEKDGRLYVIGSTRTQSGSTYHYTGRILIFKENAGGNMAPETTSYITFNLLSGVTTPYYISGTFSAGGYIFCCLDSEAYKSKSIVKISIQGSEASIESISTNAVNSLFPVTFYNKYAIWASQGTDGSNLYIYNAQSNSVEQIDMSGFGFPVASDYDSKKRTRAAYAKYEDDKLAIFFSGGGSTYLNVAVFKVSNSGNLQGLSNIFKVEYESASFTEADVYLFFLNRTVNPACYFSSATHCLAVSYNAGSHELTDFVQPDYVKPYEGGSAIGVAKQSGTSGQAVEVYVAKPSA